MNKHLNLRTDDPKIAEIINKLRKQLKPSISNDKFKAAIIELDNITSYSLSEADDRASTKIFNNLHKKCLTQIKHFTNDQTLVNNQNLGELMTDLIPREK
jgi:hypothetical protein